MKITQFTLKPFLADWKESEVCYRPARYPVVRTNRAVQRKLDSWLVPNQQLKGGGIKMADKPVLKFKIGGLCASIFLQEMEGRIVPSVVADKTFTRDGQNFSRQKITLFNATEIDKLICVLQEAKRALYLEDFEKMAQVAVVSDETGLS